MTMTTSSIITGASGGSSTSPRPLAPGVLGGGEAGPMVLLPEQNASTVYMITGDRQPKRQATTGTTASRFRIPRLQIREMPALVGHTGSYGANHTFFGSGVVGVKCAPVRGWLCAARRRNMLFAFAPLALLLLAAPASLPFMEPILCAAAAAAAALTSCWRRRFCSCIPGAE